MLHIAAQYAYRYSLKMLVEQKVSISAQDKDGMTPLHFAVQGGVSVQRLLVNGVSIDIQDSEGRTPLHIALIKYRIDRINGKTIKILLEWGQIPIFRIIMVIRRVIDWVR